MLNHPGSADAGSALRQRVHAVARVRRSTGSSSARSARTSTASATVTASASTSTDNLWVVDKGTNAVDAFNPAGYVTMNLGRRPEGPDEPEDLFRTGAGRRRRRRTVDGYFSGPTDIAFDSDDNIYISDGYTNSRVAKFDKNGNWVKSWGSRGPGGAARRTRIPGSSTRRTTSRVDRQNNVYVADRNNRRIQVFDRDGTFQRFIFLNATYDKTAPSGARQPSGQCARTKRSPGRSASPTRRRNISTRRTRSRAASTR